MNPTLARMTPPPSLAELKTFLDQGKIPVSTPRKNTFFDISGAQNDELIFSRWYAYYFKTDEEHGLGSLFIEALLALIEEKRGQELALQEFVVETEVTTQNRNRIDILIRGTGVDEGKFIVIENKIYHFVNNNLKDYWNHCLTKDESKCGILLTLNRTPVPADQSSNYINVTHLELITRVRSLTKTSTGSSKYFEEFSTAIDNLYKDYYMDNEVTFYFENLAACSRIYDISSKAYEYVLNQIRIAGELLELKPDGKAELYRYLYKPGIDGVYYTIMFNQIFDETLAIYIVIELYGKGLVLLKEIDTDLGEPYIIERGLKYKAKKYEGLWIHYAGKPYILELGDIKNLAQFIADKIKQDFSETFGEICKIIKNNAIKVGS